jgi:hypothetical protein
VTVGFVYEGSRIGCLDGPVVRWRTPCEKIATGIRQDACGAYLASLWTSMNMVPELAEHRAVELRTIH